MANGQGGARLGAGRKSKAYKADQAEKAEEFLDAIGEKGETVRQLTNYTRRLDLAYARGLCDTAMHKQLLESAKLDMRARIEDAEAERIGRMESLVVEVKRLQQAAQERAAAMRQRRNIDAEKSLLRGDGVDRADARPSSPPDTDVVPVSDVPPRT